MIVIGIDPGLSGAVAALDSASGDIVALADLPVMRDKSLAWIDGCEMQSIVMAARAGRNAHAIIERVSAMPRQGVASSFQFGVGFGSVLGTMQALHIGIELVTPSTWKRALNLSSDKHASLHKARLLFPAADLRLAKHDGRAEALLLAHWHLTKATRAAA